MARTFRLGADKNIYVDDGAGGEPERRLVVGGVASVTAGELSTIMAQFSAAVLADVSTTWLVGGQRMYSSGTALVSTGAGGGGTAVRVTPESLQAGQPSSIYLPSPYDAATFAELAPNVQAGLEERGKIAWEAMTTTQRKHLLHPGMLYIPEGFGGYTWWCTFTPYPAANSAMENPCVVASNDGRTWEMPAGAINPLVNAPSGTDFNADTHITYDEAGGRLVLLFTERTSSLLHLKLLTSTDGVTWTAPVTIWSGNFTVDKKEIISPSIFFDTAAQKWTIVGHNFEAVGKPLVKITSDNLLTGWTTTQTVLNAPTPKTDRAWWHSHFQYTTSGQIIGAVQDNDGTAGNDGDIYIIWSDDGVNFRTRYLYPGGLYRPALLAFRTGEVTTCRMWLSALARDDLREVDLRDDRMFPVLQEHAIFSSLIGIAERPGAATRLLAADNFNRADSVAGTNPIGTALTGQTYTQGDGTDTFGVVSNAAVNVTTGNCRTVVDAARDVDFRALIKTRNPSSDECNLIYRWSDYATFYRVLIGVEAVAVQRVIGGVATQLGTAVVTRFNPAGSIVRVVVTGNQHSVYVDGLLWLQFVETAETFPNGAGVGFQSSGIAQGMAIEAFVATLP